MVIMPGICGTHSQVRLTGAVDARDNNACRAVRIRQIRYTPRWMQEPIHKPGATLSVHCGDVKENGSHIFPSKVMRLYV